MTRRAKGRNHSRERRADVDGFRSGLSYPEELPISEQRQTLVEAITANQVVIVAGETGSGKSTQLPKLCVEAGRGAKGLIGHTQPRRLAARSIAERIAEETNTTVGKEVGYSVRFNDRIGPETIIRLMTDGILLAELQNDRNLRRYDTIIIDEAHERSLNIDFILGYLKQLLPRRPDLHVIVTSATIDVDRFSKHFDDAPIIEVSGRTYPVDIRYQPYDGSDNLGANGQPNNRRRGGGGPEILTQVDAITAAVSELVREGPGDMLVFLAGERDIRETAEALNGLGLPDTEVFPLFARLSSGEQHRVFQPHRGRRIVLATNVAETSVTVPGIRFVIDPGNARISRFNTRTKVQRLPIEEVSQASANQRAGRCGRIGPGICVRLYSEDNFETRDPFTEPEILRTNLASVILQMASLGLGDIEEFPFIEPPEHRGIADGIALLEELDALDPDHHGTSEWLTPLGRELARLPVDPRFARMIIEGADNGALAEVLIIVAVLSIQDPRERPSERGSKAAQEAAESHSRFNHPKSDFVTLLKLWRHLERNRNDLSNNQFRRMCRREYLNYNRVREWQDTRRQLEETASSLGYRPSGNRAEVDVIHQCLLAGLLSHIGMKNDRRPDKSKRRGGRSGTDRADRPGGYLGARGAKFRLGRESVLAENPPAWVMAAELIETNQMWARMAAPIDPAWAERLGSYLIKHSYSDPEWVADDGVAYTRERITLYGLPIVDGRRRTVASVNPDLSRELLLRHALVRGEWTAHHRFIDRNRELLADLAELETRSRRDLLVEEEAVFDFFDQRIPDHVVSVASFNRWWKKQKIEDPSVLDLTADDLIRPDIENIGVEDFPNHWDVGDIELELAYTHDGASTHDGVSVHIPVEVLNQVEAWPFEWTVPGFRPALVSSLVRSLPKEIRRDLNPIAETVAAVIPDLAARSDSQRLLPALAEALGPRAGAVIDPDAFSWERVPSHLRPMFRVINADRELVAEGKDLEALKDLLADHTRQVIADAARRGSDVTRSGLTSWTFGTLPPELETDAGNHTVRAYPALVDKTDSVAIELLPTVEEQQDAMWLGVRRLLRLQLPAPVRTLDRLLDDRTKLSMTVNPTQTRAQWYNDVIDCALDDIIANAGGPPSTESGFEALVAEAKDSLIERLETLVPAVSNIVQFTGRIDERLTNMSNLESLDVPVADARAHFTRLAYPGMVAGVGFEHVEGVARYLEALDYRLDRIPENPGTDVMKAAEAVGVEALHADLVGRLGMTEELEAALWQLEELRVSLFAQHLRPSGPGKSKVSARKVERGLRRIAADQ